MSVGVDGGCASELFQFLSGSACVGCEYVVWALCIGIDVCIGGGVWFAQCQ
jgi:hypothetical protein